MQRSAQKRGKVGLQDATAESVRRCAGVFDGTDEMLQEVIDVLGAAVGQVALGQAPDPLIGIQLRRVAGEMLQTQTRMLPEQLVQWLAFMRWGLVQKHNHRAGQVPKQMAEEDAHLLPPDVAEPKLVIKAEILSLGTDRDPRDHGDSVSATAVVQGRSVAARGPGLDHVGDQQEAGFVGEDEVGAQPRGVFFIRGQSLCFHRSMACSSRSVARRSGFW
jgi:hypothetical protein